MFDCRTQSNLIVRLSSINETFDLVRVVTSGTCYSLISCIEMKITRRDPLVNVM